jgi:hypothetical protein
LQQQLQRLDSILCLYGHESHDTRLAKLDLSRNIVADYVPATSYMSRASSLSIGFPCPPWPCDQSPLTGWLGLISMTTLFMPSKPPISPSPLATAFHHRCMVEMYRRHPPAQSGRRIRKVAQTATFSTFLEKDLKYPMTSAEIAVQVPSFSWVLIFFVNPGGYP